MSQGVTSYFTITVSCMCGNEFETRSVAKQNFRVGICGACHPTQGTRTSRREAPQAVSASGDTGNSVYAQTPMDPAIDL